MGWQTIFANSMGERKKIVIYGVLNWGLGHATRSIPIIEALGEEGFQVVLASDGAAGKLLRQRFPSLPYEELPAYNISYGKSGPGLNLALQLPKILRAARRENRQLKSLAEKYRVRGVISDNRLGFYHRDVPSVYVTHQLKIMTPFSRKLVSRMHHRFIQHFDECWVPDVENRTGLTGEMGHSLKPKIPLRYTGWLSRFSGKLPAGAKQYRACAILSGPEPQRTLLEKKLLQQFRELKGSFLLIRGREEAVEADIPENVRVLNLAGSDQVLEAIASSEIVISRSGYSSIMDYAALGNNALLIPTPGQPEQEYLARYLLSRGYFYYAAQEFLDLEDDFRKASQFSGVKKLQNSRPHWPELFAWFS